MADHFAEICSSTPRVPWTNDRRRSLDSFRVSSDLPRGVIPRPIVRAALELPRLGTRATGSTYTIIYSRDLLDGQSLIVLLLAALSPPLFLRFLFSTGFLTSRPSYFFARAFFIRPVYRFLFSDAPSFSPERS